MTPEERLKAAVRLRQVREGDFSPLDQAVAAAYLGAVGAPTPLRDIAARFAVVEDEAIRSAERMRGFLLN